MNTLIDLFVHSAVRGMILAAVALMLHRATRAWLSAAVRHRGVICALAALGLIPILIGGCDGWKVLPALAASPAPQPEISHPPPPVPNTANSTSPAQKSSPPSSSASVMLAGKPLPPASAVASSADRVTSFDWKGGVKALFWTWMAGVCVGTTALGCSFYRLYRLWSASTPWHGSVSMELAQLCSERTGLKRLPRLKLAADNSGPLVFGFATQGVLLPTGFDDWPEERRQAVLMHEFAHVRRRDALSHLLAACVCVMHWFNPFVWLLFKKARHEAECACDDVVLHSNIPPVLYADHLLAVASGGHSASVLAPSMACPSSLKRRVKAVLDARARRGVVRWYAAAAITGVALVIGLPVMLAQTADPKRPAVPAPKTEPPKTAVTVKFRDEAGKPLTAVDLRLFRVDKPEPISPFAPELSVTCDASGEWQGEIEPGEYIVLAIKQDLVAGGARNQTYLEISKKDKNGSSNLFSRLAVPFTFPRSMPQREPFCQTPRWWSIQDTAAQRMQKAN